MMNVFGNGVIDGWTVSQTGAFTVSISEGHGNINYMSGRTTSVQELTVAPSSTSYIYAKVVRNTLYTEEVLFTASTSTINDPNFILISEVTAGPLSIIRIDNTVRREISFVTLIRDLIADHKHRGGLLNPSKIDLSSEVKGQLPGFRVADFDADKITSGTFNLARLPLINHQDLQNVGLLTHPQLDTFVKTLETSNKELFGEIGTANLLQMILALKLIYNDPESAFYLSDRVVDENFINEFAVIPGITPDTRIDFENTTAEVNLVDHYIKGLAATFGTSFYIRWEDHLAWSTAINPLNVDTSGDEVVLLQQSGDASNTTVLDTFEEEPYNIQFEQITLKETNFIRGGSGQGYNDSGAVVLDAGANHIYTFRWDYQNPATWVGFDEFRIDVKCLTTNHGPIQFFFMDADAGSLSTMFDVGAEHRSQTFSLVDTGEDTVDRPNAFKTVSVNLNEVDRTTFDMTRVKSIVFYTYDSVQFITDNMKLLQAILLPESGSFKLRYSTSTQVTFQRLEYSADLPAGTDVKVRARASNGTAMLNRSDWTPYLDNEAEIGLSGTDLEIEVSLYANSARTLSPTIQWIRVVVVTDAEMDGFTINTTQEFSRGSADDVHVDDNTVVIDEPVSVGSYYYAGFDKIVQLYHNTSVSPSRIDGEISIFSTKAPIAPNEVFRALEENTSVNESAFYNPRSAKRLRNGSYLVADTYNDRILHFNTNGDLIEGFGSINYSHSSMTFPISACIDKRTGILYVVWSRPVQYSGVLISGFALQNGTTRLPLLVGYDLINNLPPDRVSGEGQVMEVHLSSQNKALVSQWPSTGCRLIISGNTVPEGIGNSDFYRKLTTTGAIPMYVGNFFYTESGSPKNISIFSPTYVEYTSAGTYLYTNAMIAVKDFSFTSTDETVSLNATTTVLPTIVEVDLSKTDGQQVVFACDFVNFSPFVPGRATRISSDMILAGGLSKTGELKPADPNVFNFRNIHGTDAMKTSQKQVLNTMFFDPSLIADDKVYKGDIRTISTLQPGGTELFQYNSATGTLVSDVLLDSATDEIVAAESCFIGQSGRIIRVDNDGNITYSFGEGSYNMINDIELLEDGSFVIST